MSQLVACNMIRHVQPDMFVGAYWWRYCNSWKKSPQTSALVLFMHKLQCLMWVSITQTTSCTSPSVWMCSLGVLSFMVQRC